MSVVKVNVNISLLVPPGQQNFGNEKYKPICFLVKEVEMHLAVFVGILYRHFTTIDGISFYIFESKYEAGTDTLNVSGSMSEDTEEYVSKMKKVGWKFYSD